MVRGRHGGGDGLAGLMKGLKLTEEEKCGVRVAWRKEEEDATQVPQAVGKLFSRRPGNIEGMVQTLGKIWCPSKGISCKDIGDNLFLFSFLQPGGKKRAVTEGPWEFGGDLLLVVDFDGSKRLKDIEFNFVPMWIRVFDLPLRMMNEATGKAIGDKVGKALEVDSDVNGSAVGGYLRVKVRLDVRKPLLRGVFLEKEDGERGDWCPIQYEFLPNFCYECGILGHVDRECDVNMGKEEKQQYGDWLRASPARRKMSGDSRSWRFGGSSSGRGRQQHSPEKLEHKSGKELIQQNTSSQKESCQHLSEPQDDGTSLLKVQDTEQNVLKSGTEENLEELKRDVLQKEAVAEGKGREDEGNLLLSQGEVDEIEKEMDIDSNLQLSATTEIDNDDIMKKQGDIEMKLRTFRRIPRPYNEVVSETKCQ